MKKKFLSLMMAAAVVATTSVSAFADTNITGSENSEHEAQVQIKGDVTDDSGNVKPGNLNVTVPTKASFKVNDKGQLLGTNITVKNDGTQKVDVFAYEFLDATGADDINVKKESEITTSQDQVERKNISLKLTGTSATAYFGSATGQYKRGVYSDKELASAVDSATNPLKLATVNPTSSVDLELSGTAGKKTGLTEAVQDNFTLVLKIKKSTENS